MKLLLLVFLSVLNLVGYFTTSDIYDTLFLIPLISILCSIGAVFPTRNGGKIKIKLIYFVLFGVLYFNVPLYISSLIDVQDTINSLFRLGVSGTNFTKACFLLGMSVPLIVCGYLMPHNRLGKKYKKTPISRFILPRISLYPFIILSVVFLMLAISVTGFRIGSTFIGASSYYYVLLFRSMIILLAGLIFNTLLENRGQIPSFITFSKKHFGVVALFFTFFVYVLIGGDRGPALTLLIIVSLGYLLMNDMKVRISNLIGIIFLIMLVNLTFSFVGVLRQSDAEKLTIETISSNFSAYSNEESQLGATVRTTMLAIEGIEDGFYSHSYGLFFVQSIIKGVPFFGPIFLENILGSNYIDGTADLLTIQHSGIGYSSGIGSSYLADTFIEFGIFGVLFFSFIYGVIIGIFERKCRERSFKNFGEFVLICLFVGYSFYLGRSSLTFFLGNFIHTMIFFYVVRYVLLVFGFNIYKFRGKAKL